MSGIRLLLRNLRYHWRTNVAVVIAVVAGTAVIVGALIVGDSVRGSMRRMTLDRLGKVDDVLVAPSFFDEERARQLTEQPGFDTRFSAMAPALMLPGTFTAEHDKRTRRAGKVQVFGLDDRLWGLLEHGDVAVPTGQEVVINARLARELGVAAGDDVSLWVQPPAAIPRESLLGKREGDFHEVPLKVRAVLNESIGAGRLALQPNQQPPANAFVALKTLQGSVGLARREPSRRDPQGSPARVNTLFAAALDPNDQAGSDAAAAAAALDVELGQILTSDDLALRIVKAPRGYLSVESQRQILENDIATAAEKSAEHLGMATSPVFDYLANEIDNGSDPKKYSMYSIVAGLDPVTTNTSPFGPFVWASARPDEPLGPDEIVLDDWLAGDLGVKPHDKVRMRYHLVGSHGELPEEERTFEVAGILKLDGTPAADPSLVPVVKGITDAKTLRDWDQPFPMKLDRITQRDEDFWDKYHATPKSFVSLETAQGLWGSRFGNLTSVRVAPRPGQDLSQAAALFEAEFMESLTPAQTHMQFQPVKALGVGAAVGSNDFSELFLGFSFFLILAAALLVGLIFRLGIERRGTTIGLLSAVGFTPRRIRRLYLLEGLLLVVIGGLLGIAAGVGYAELMVFGLTHWWNQAVGTTFLYVYVVPLSLVTGFVSSVVVAMLAVAWGLRQMRLLSPRELLSGATERQLPVGGQRRRARRSLLLGSVLVVVAALTIVPVLRGSFGQSEAFEGMSWSVVLFFVDGMILLTAGILLVSGLLDSERSGAVRGRGAVGLARLGVRNTARHRQRSTTSVALIASATFVVVAVAAGRRNPAVEAPDRNSGNGGFRLVAESTEPILFDLNTRKGRDKLDVRAAAGSPEAALLSNSQVFAFRVKPGEDASCLNIYQTRIPTILGVPKSLIERGGFRFIGSRESNPWKILSEARSDGSIPVFGDANTLQYSLHKEVGQTIPLPDAEHPQHTLAIAGMLDGSVFQGVLLMSEENFRRVFPDVAGYRYFLIDVPGKADDAARLSDLLEAQLTPYGFDAEPVADRLANFLAVQNTYLSTFQTLGGFGLLLGTLGLATVMIRNVLERRSELALLSALGFRPSGLAWLVLTETAVLLVAGLATGTVAALVAMLPHLLSIGADFSVPSLVSILVLVFVVGMVAALVASFEAARTPILEGLRSE
jgi:putative ABC transport system permease protein